MELSAMLLELFLLSIGLPEKRYSTKRKNLHATEIVFFFARTHHVQSEAEKSVCTMFFAPLNVSCRPNRKSDPRSP
jgi:hypothetical protein